MELWLSIFSWPHTTIKELGIYHLLVFCRLKYSSLHSRSWICSSPLLLTGSFKPKLKTNKNTITNFTPMLTYSGINTSKFINHSNQDELRYMETLMIRYSSLSADFYAHSIMWGELTLLNMLWDSVPLYHSSKKKWIGRHVIKGFTA